tara:strand:+ start:51 stop:254 length:204 start_codon:yes stop_codon:yes gene_type:complete
MSEEAELKKLNDSLHTLSVKMEYFVKEVIDEQKKTNDWLYFLKEVIVEQQKTNDSLKDLYSLVSDKL